MVVAFDADILSLLMYPSIDPPNDPKTRKAVTHARERLEHLVEQLESKDARIVVPTPALAEFLAVAGDEGPHHLTVIQKQAVFRIAPFDTMAAVEAAAMTQAALAGGDKKDGATGSWQNVKVDRQIVAVAKCHSVEEIYSNDSDMPKIAGAIKVVSVWHLPLPPPDDSSLPLPFDETQ